MKSWYSNLIFWNFPAAFSSLVQTKLAVKIQREKSEKEKTDFLGVKLFYFEISEEISQIINQAQNQSSLSSYKVKHIDESQIQVKEHLWSCSSSPQKRHQDFSWKWLILCNLYYLLGFWSYLFIKNCCLTVFPFSRLLNQ